MKHTVMAVLVAGALLLSAGNVALAAGKMGGASDFDRSLMSDTVLVGGKVGEDMDHPTALTGSKLGIAPD